MLLSRNLTDSIVNLLQNDAEHHEIIFLLGTRQTGKTSLTRLVAEASDFNSGETFFFDLEDKEYRTLFGTGSIAELNSILRLEGIDPARRSLLIFDEVQLLDDPANLLKLLHDHFPELRIIATGSSSLQIKQKFSDSLAGRKRVFLVRPLDFDEFLLFKEDSRLLQARKLFRENPNDAVLPRIMEAYHDRFLGLLEEYLIFGGYPEVVLSESKTAKAEKLNSIVTSYIQKDIREFGNIENIDGYNNLLKYLAVNTGAQFNLASAQSTVGLSGPTLKKYLGLLQETFIIKEVPPFFTNKNKEISKSKKIFFTDTGIRNLQIKNFNIPSLRSDIGPLYENYVFTVLEQDADLLTSNYFYRTQAKTEIDFITVREQQCRLIEVKAGTFDRPVKAMSAFEKKYQRQFAGISKTVVNRSCLARKNGFRFLPAWLL